jgi:ribosome recycling factor
MESVEEVLLDGEEKMIKSVAFLQEQFTGLRTGKASPALVENIQVPYYGTPTRLREMANISTPEPRLIIIQPYDPSILGEIEKAIMGANLGVTPMNDGRLVRVPIPELSEERRVEMTKIAKRTAEEARVAVRSIRREGNDLAKALQKDGKITEDERDAALKEIQTLTDKFVGKVDDATKAKEAEIMEV